MQNVTYASNGSGLARETTISVTDATASQAVLDACKEVAPSLHPSTATTLVAFGYGSPLSQAYGDPSDEAYMATTRASDQRID